MTRMVKTIKKDMVEETAGKTRVGESTRKEKGINQFAYKSAAPYSRQTGRCADHYAGS
jgi:hypothetical protein